MRRVNPLGVLVRGALAGAAGSFAQDRFFAATSWIAPRSPEGAFNPPEDQQRQETGIETVSRRFVEQFMQRGRLTPEEKKKGGVVVHYAYGAGWGKLYGVLAESVIGMRSVPGALLFGTGVWVIGDNLAPLAFRLAGPPSAYPTRVHAYALAAHWAYALTVHATYDLLRGPRLILGAAALGALALRRRDRRERAREKLRRVMGDFEDRSRPTPSMH